MADTLAKLALRQAQETQAKQGLTQKFTLDGATRPAYEFLFGTTTGTEQSDSRQELAALLRDNPEQVPASVHSGLDDQGEAPHLGATAGPVALEHPEQFSISWTNFPDVYETGLPSLPEWAASLTDADAATRQFWPMIAEHGFGYNLIIPEV